MPRAQLANNASTTLAAGINTLATSLSVATGSGALFPVVTSYFYVTLKEGAAIEIVKVTARTGDAFTIVRAQDNTTAQSFTTAATVSLNLVAAVLGEFLTADNAYTHPASHPPAIIAQDATNRFVTDAEKTAWNAKGVGDVTLAGVQTITNKTITETVFALTGTTPALTATNGAVQTWTLTAASTPTDALTTGQSIILMITPGAFAITWPAGTIWTKQGGSGVAPTLFSAGKTMVVLWRVGAVLYGSHLGDTV